MWSARTAVLDSTGMLTGPNASDPFQIDAIAPPRYGTALHEEIVKGGKSSADYGFGKCRGVRRSFGPGDPTSCAWFATEALVSRQDVDVGLVHEGVNHVRLSRQCGPASHHLEVGRTEPPIMQRGGDQDAVTPRLREPLEFLPAVHAASCQQLDLREGAADLVHERRIDPHPSAHTGQVEHEHCSRAGIERVPHHVKRGARVGGAHPHDRRAVAQVETEDDAPRSHGANDGGECLEGGERLESDHDRSRPVCDHLARPLGASDPRVDQDASAECRDRVKERPIRLVPRDCVQIGDVEVVEREYVAIGARERHGVPAGRWQAGAYGLVPVSLATPRVHGASTHEVEHGNHTHGLPSLGKRA